MNNPISITVHSEKSSLLGAPIPVSMAVTNTSQFPIEILLPYPNPNNLAFGCITQGLAKPKQIERQEIERTIPVKISPGTTYSSIYYLNRYLAFNNSGRADISYRLTALVSWKDETGKMNHNQAAFDGRFEITLVEGSVDQLRTLLGYYRGRLTNPDRKEKMQAAEALAFLDTPLSVEFVAPMLSLDNLETIGIDALSRHPSEQSQRLIVSMLAHRDSSVVAAALAAINRIPIPISRQEILKLLASDNPNIRWLGLDWLSNRPDSSDLRFLAPVVSDQNDAVRELAKRYADILRKIN